MKIAEFFASISLRPDPRGINDMNRMFRTMRGAAIGLGALFTGGALAKGMISFNARVEDSKNSIAAMLGLATKTTLTSNLSIASQLYDDIRKKASELPGTTEDYVQAMAKLTLPVMTAKGSLAELKDLTVATIVAAKGGVGGATVKTAITDVLQGIEGRFSTTDFFLKAILEPMGFEGKKGRDRFKALDKQKRYQTLLKGLQNPIFRELADRQANSWTGQMDKMREATAQFLGAVGLPLFKMLTRVLQSANKWLDKNKSTVDSVASAIGNGLVKAFGVLATVVKFFADNSDEARAILYAILTVAGILIGQMIAGWLLFLAPILLVTARIAALWYLFDKLRKWLKNDFVAAIITVFAGVLLFRIGAVTKAVWGMVQAFRAARAASTMGAVGQGAGAAINAMGALSLGAAGKGGPIAAGGKMPAGGGKGAGAGAGAGMLGFLGPVGMAVGAALVIDQLVPTDEKIQAMMDHYTSVGKHPWEAYKQIDKAGSIDKAYEQTFGNQTNNITVNVNGVQNASEMTPAMIEAWEKEMRHLLVATQGGKR